MGKRSRKRPAKGKTSGLNRDGMIGSDEIPIEMMQSLATKRWRLWFDDPVPVLGDMTPREAAETQEGRQKVDDLLEYYDSLRGGMARGFDVNIPSDYARWKLGYGPGSAEEFAKEEAILNHVAEGERPTERKERHAQRLEKRKVSIFVPRRCEFPGCEKKGKDDVRGCSRCNGCAYYCGREHQVQDWPRHKLDCKFLSNLDVDIRPRPFNSSEEIEKYPLGCFPVDSKPSGGSEQVKCFICHSKQSEVDITYTRCCNLPVCDNAHEYVPGSYSRDFCLRSHTMYTKCFDHFESGHEGDWRECKICNKMESEARPFASTNGFSATPCMDHFLPQGSMMTYACGVTFCKNRILPGHSNTSFKDGVTMCEVCSGGEGTTGHTVYL